ncbi:sensor histidine kinase [Microvirga zambiensis]|uniref:sensor histidine kinase n=1 Tax=Microvirga zambiensis TaxID=1402137 RepID=UPI00191DBE46|nr:PAS domain S-box protein [Microvirga zambiensis]
MSTHTVYERTADSRTLRLLASEKRVLGLVAAGVPIANVLEELVLAVEAEANGEMLGSILLLDEGGRHLLHGAAPNLPAAYNTAIHGVEVGEAVGSCGTAAHRGEPVFVTDIATDPLWNSVVELPLAHGLRACWSIPIRGADGRLLGTFGNYYREPRSPTVEDLEVIAQVTHTAALVIERHLSDQALRESENRFRTLIELSPQVVWFCGADGQVTYCNPFWHEFSGLTLEETQGGGWASIIHPDHRNGIVARWQRALGSLTAFEVEIPFRRAGGGDYRWFVVRTSPVHNANGEVGQWIGIAFDIHERKRAEEARELLARELFHRIKNVFTVVGGLASLTARRHPAAAPYARELQQRIGALASAHDHASPQGPAGPGHHTFHDLVNKLLAPYAGGIRDRFDISGDDALIGSNAATALALIIHEQATNAVKYGALSTDIGRIRIQGRRSDGSYWITWSESGGPTVSGPPQRLGFGSVMAMRSSNDQLGGGIEHEWAPEGLVIRLTVPLANLAR